MGARENQGTVNRARDAGWIRPEIRNGRSQQSWIFSGKPRARAAVYGADATIHIGRWDRKWGYKLFDKAGKLVEHNDNDSDNESDDAHLRNFIECIRSAPGTDGGKLPNADISVGHLSAIHCHLANIVVRTGGNVAFDQESETAIDNPAANRYVQRRYREHWSTPKNV